MDLPLRAGTAPARTSLVSEAHEHFLVTSAGEAFVLVSDRSFTFGRSASADFVARSSEVSREHARLISLPGEPSGWMLENLGPPNGTFVNGERLPDKGARRLEHGDRITLASNTVFHYFFTSHEHIDRVVDQFGVEELTAQWALKDIQAKKESRRVDRPPRPKNTPPPKLPQKGNLSATRGTQLLGMVRDTRFTGELTFFDGAQEGKLRFMVGEPLAGSLGREGMDAALAALTAASHGNYRTRLQIPERASFDLIPAIDLLILLYDLRASGVLSLFRPGDAALAGRLVLLEGLCVSAGFGRAVARAALESVSALDRGGFAWEAKTAEELDGQLMTPRAKREALDDPEPPPGR